MCAALHNAVCGGALLRTTHLRHAGSGWHWDCCSSAGCPSAAAKYVCSLQQRSSTYSIEDWYACVLTHHNSSNAIGHVPQSKADRGGGTVPVLFLHFTMTHAATCSFESLLPTCCCHLPRAPATCSVTPAAAACCCHLLLHTLRVAASVPPAAPTAPGCNPHPTTLTPASTAAAPTPPPAGRHPIMRCRVLHGRMIVWIWPAPWPATRRVWRRTLGSGILQSAMATGASRGARVAPSRDVDREFAVYMYFCERNDVLPGATGDCAHVTQRGVLYEPCCCSCRSALDDSSSG